MDDNKQNFIVLRAVSQRRSDPVKVSPLQDKTGKTYTGQGQSGYYEGLSQKEKDELSYLVTPFTTVALLPPEHIINLNDEVDSVNWKWMQKHPYIADNKKEAEASRDAVFYIYDENKEAETEEVTEGPVVKAEYIVMFESSYEDLVDAAASLGHPYPTNLRFSTLKKWFKDFINGGDGRNRTANANLVIDTLKPENKKQANARKLFHKLVRNSVISKFKGGVYRFGGPEGAFIGRNENEIVDYMLNDDNQETVAAMTATLEDVKQSIEA